MNPTIYDEDRSEEMIAQALNRLVREQARTAGLLDADKRVRESARLPAPLIEAAKQRTHATSDAELLEIALSRLALEDDFGIKLVRRKGVFARCAGSWMSDQEVANLGGDHALTGAASS